jgi:hypothetical protein
MPSFVLSCSHSRKSQILLPFGKFLCMAYLLPELGMRPAAACLIDDRAIKYSLNSPVAFCTVCGRVGGSGRVR